MQCIKFTLLLVLFLTPEPAPAWKADVVKSWARNLGEELWKLSESLTKSDQIRIKYKQMNASVKKKDGTQILESSLRSVSTMLTRKINAVKCIHAKAEQLAKSFEYFDHEQISQENFTFDYCSSKYSEFEYENKEDTPNITEKWTVPGFAVNNSNYQNIFLERDSHFYDIYVNTNYSCVHVPTNIYYKEENALNVILWSKGLNEVFTQNYRSDPSLSWQYFGSSHGILRFYPGMPWNKNIVDTYDCRVKSWYIEAATCSKDVIILFDVSGSMTGFKNYVARRTLRSLLETLSNNDFVNVYTFKNTVAEVISCFKGLVQATRENLNTLRDRLEPTNEGKNHKVKLELNANLTQAYIDAFTTLKARRHDQKCNITSTQGCNQLVMVITDYVPGNLTEVFDEYNREEVDGKSYTPVRVFTYLIGKEVTNVNEITSMACTNRGYFVHIHSVEEVQQQVFKYINVIARPMILDGSMPPPTWTHANIDETRTKTWNVSFSDIGKPDEDKLVTSVAIPAFDYKSNEGKNKAMLLGVAGTDVPIDSIAKLAQPHQLGVNGYSFIVSNNGYILLHPLLITTINGELQENYNSVDFVEVEQVDDGKGSRELGEQIKQLRKHLVYGDDDSMKEIKVLYHYDQMRRIARVQHDYFFNELEGTPFSMGISLPKGYGDTELLLKDNPLEAKQGKDVTGINVTDYFRFSYRVHPDWVYCKYHYLEGHETANPESELWNFLVKLSKNEIDITKKQYKEEAQSKNFSFDANCGNNQARGSDDYYCNEDLVKQLVFDAKLTTPYFDKWHASNAERILANTYNVSVRFIATSSGLTRWHYIFDDDKNEKISDHGQREKKFKGEVFGDTDITAIEETWYKAAVLQHMINKESLVIATRLPILDDIIENKKPVENDDGDITITATYAIFYKDGDSETPASVVGFEYSFLSFKERFLHITESTRKNKNEDLSCNDTKYDCYVIDSSGYIVLSQDKSEVGKFFGHEGSINKYVMQTFVDLKIFDHVEVFNYQALCPLSMLPPQDSSSWPLMTPFTLIKNFIYWLLTEALFMISSVYNADEYAYAASLIDDGHDHDIIDDIKNQPTPAPDPTPHADQKESKGKESKGKESKDKESIGKEKKEKPFSCDHSISLYILNQTHFLHNMGASPVVSNEEPTDCSPAYWASYVPNTNLLLVVVDNEWDYSKESDCKTPPSTKPVPTPNSTDIREPCHKLDLGSLRRRRLDGCYTYHDAEKDIVDCGLGNNIRGNYLIYGTTTLLAIIGSQLFM